MEAVDKGDVTMIAALIAAGAVVLAASLTGLLQMLVAARQHRAQARTVEAERKRELYLRWLQLLTNLPADLWDAVVEGTQGELLRRVPHQLADLRAQMWVDGSPEIRRTAAAIPKAWSQFLHCYHDLATHYDVDLRETRPHVPAFLQEAWDEAFCPVLEDFTSHMRDELIRLNGYTPERLTKGWSPLISLERYRGRRTRARAA